MISEFNYNSMTQKQRILAVDDNRVNLILLKEMLSEHYEVVSFSDPVKALQHFFPETFDLVISDFMMPEMHGIELLEKIRQIDSNVPFIISSANNDEENIRAAYQAGVDKYLLKPLNIATLNNTVKRFIKIKKNCI